MIYSENILICIAIPLFIALFFTRTSTKRFLFAFILGMTVCLFSAYISGFVNYITELGRDEMAIYYSPVIEEIMKFLPILFYEAVFIPEQEKLYTASIGIGLGFATFENCCYILSAVDISLPYMLIRGLSVGVMHLICSLALILGLGLSKRFEVMTLPGLVGAISMPMIFHALYNLLVSEDGLSSYLGYFLPILTAFILFIPFRVIREKLNNE
ncbi:MAG: PrsW family intramembrane metalloprotease [Lachnospiraceae bacterium]|nr:PrsW family intramembrane metalloprotease [Lachnospiraceae bacterium]